jgi:NitT/TauT family transport system permease protein
MKNFIKKHGVSIGLSLLSIAFMLVCWIITSASVKNEVLVPSLSAVFAEMKSLLVLPSFYGALLQTFLRTVYSVLIAYLVAGLLVILTIAYKPLRSFFAPIISALRVVPTMAVLLMILIFTMNNPNLAPIIVSLLVLVPLVYHQFLTSFNEIDDGVISTAKVFGIKKRDRIFKIYLPLVLPSNLASVGTNLSFSIKLIISAEILAYTYNGLGGLMRDASNYFQVSRLAGLTLFAIIIGILVEVLFSVLSKVCFRWNTVGVKYD